MPAPSRSVSMRLDQETFLQRLTELLKTAETKGSVYLEQKRLSKNGADPKMDATSSPYSLLFRATDGVKDKKVRIKFSTQVSPSDLPDFWLKYSEVLKAGMPGLLKKEKKKKK